MDIRLKDIQKGIVSDVWLNKIIKTNSPDANPTEKGEKDKDLDTPPKDGAYLPKRRPRKGGGK
jgi:hypothetical protein